ncbi:MAG: putative toxin-antitoxin system toxin component, PIN family [Burkholderiales bacterium]
MGAGSIIVRVVFDTNTVVSALLFRGELSWLVEHWRSGASVALISRPVANELLRVLHYPKFALSESQIEVIVSLYLPSAERIDVDADAVALPQCRDPRDQMFLALAEVGRADVLVTGDRDLLDMQRQVSCEVETPAAYRARFP